MVGGVAAAPSPPRSRHHAIAMVGGVAAAPPAADSTGRAASVLAAATAQSLRDRRLLMIFAKKERIGKQEQ